MSRAEKTTYWPLRWSGFRLSKHHRTRLLQIPRKSHEKGLRRPRRSVTRARVGPKKEMRRNRPGGGVGSGLDSYSRGGGEMRSGIKQVTIGAGLVLWIVAEHRLRQELHRNTLAQRNLRRDERVK